MGAVTPLATVTVTSQISGYLMSVGFKEGQLVKKGQLLAQIDPRPYEVALEQDEAQLARDEATLKQAQMDLTRYETLSGQQSIARQTYEDQVWTVKQDQGTVDFDKAQIKAQQLNLTYCRIVAPTDGRVGLRQVDPGNYVQTGSTHRHRGAHGAQADDRGVRRAGGQRAASHGARARGRGAARHGFRSRQRDADSPSGNWRRSIPRSTPPPAR